MVPSGFISSSRMKPGGRLEKLETPEVYYEVKWRAGGFMRELKINPDGTIR